MSEQTSQDKPAVVGGVVPLALHEEALEKFLKEFDRARNVADDEAGPNKPVKVRAKVRVQMGQEVLLAACPRCHTIAALSGEGRHLCARCHLWLQYVREG